MDVTFLIPCHNNAQLLANTLAGIVTQESHPLDVEVVVVDNNSDDTSTAEVQFRFRDSLKITLVQQPQLPSPFALCKARNTGLRLAEGRWIASLDADTIPNRHYMGTLAARMAEWGDRPILATSERVFVSTEGLAPRDILDEPTRLDRLPLTASASNYGLPIDRRLPDMRLLPDTPHPWDYFHGCNVVYRRADALMIGGHDEAYDGRWGFEDIAFAHNMIADAGCVPVYVENLHVFHQETLELTHAAHRLDKRSNPNWSRICAAVPGYRQHKCSKYRRISEDIQF